MQTVILNAESRNEGARLDKFISEHSELTRSYAAKLCEDGCVIICGRPASKKYKISGTEEITINMPEIEMPSAKPENIPLDIVYEDDDLIVINKEQGMCVHPAPGNENGTLVNALMYHCNGSLSAINGVIRPGIVHRIDKDTSGLIVAAKNNDAHIKLSSQLKERKAVRKYIALVNGNIKEDEGVINKPISRNPSDRKKMAIVCGGREAVTHFKVLERYGGRYTLVECILETGRTHQIRVHMMSIGHSIVGDKVYGIKKEKFALNGQLLHAQTIGFEHPATSEYMEFSSDLPIYFKKILENLKKSS